MIDILIVQHELTLDPTDIDAVIHPVQASQKSRLATARRTDERDHLIAADIQADVLDCAILPVKYLHVAELEFGIVGVRFTDGFAFFNRRRLRAGFLNSIVHRSDGVV